MGVYFIDMKIPESCLGCPMRKWHIIHGEKITYCMAAVKLIDDENEKPNWCSAQEIQTPHGSLIDVDVILAQLREMSLDDLSLAEDLIEHGIDDVLDDAPTIIERED